MDLKNEKMLKTVGLCAAGLVGTLVSPFFAHIALGLAAGYLYSNAPKTKQNFFKMGGGLLAAAFVGVSPLGLLATAAYGYFVHPLMKQKGQAFYGRPYEQEFLDNVSKSAKKLFSSKR